VLPRRVALTVVAGHRWISAAMPLAPRPGCTGMQSRCAAGGDGPRTSCRNRSGSVVIARSGAAASCPADIQQHGEKSESNNKSRQG